MRWARPSTYYSPATAGRRSRLGGHPRRTTELVITAFALLAQYDGKIIIPLADVCRDFFTHLTVKTFRAKVSAGEIEIPVVRIDDSAKAPLGIHVDDLAAYIDKRTRLARREAG